MDLFHDFTKIDLQNRYLKEKLTEFYKENKRLHTHIKELLDENETLRVERHRDDCTTRKDHATSPIVFQKSEKPPKPDSQTVLQRNLLLTSGSKCSVCVNKSKSNTKSSLSFCKNKSSQTDFAEKTSIAVNTFDKDVYNRQNKVYHRPRINLFQ